MKELGMVIVWFHAMQFPVRLGIIPLSNIGLESATRHRSTRLSPLSQRLRNDESFSFCEISCQVIDP